MTAGHLRIIQKLQEVTKSSKLPLGMPPCG